MITEFKIFENVDQGEPQVGDYAICAAIDDKDNIIPGEIYNMTDDDEKCLPGYLNNIGKIKKCAIPLSNFETDKFYVIRFGQFMHYALREEILHWSKNFDDLKVFVDANNYNL